MIRARWRVRGDVLDPNQGTVIMGVLNVTPDSFSDGGIYVDPDRAIAAGLEMHAAGAAIVDVGGESTRPGAAEIPAEEERRRIEPVVKALADAGVRVSIDTAKPAVAAAALASGAVVVNDVTGLGAEGMAELCADAGAGVVIMHMQGNPRTMQDDPQYVDVVREVEDYLVGRRRWAIGRGVDPEAIALDPGIGFGKTLEHNLALLRAIPRLSNLGSPVVIGTSRKGFLGRLTGRAPAQRDVVTAVSVGMAVVSGASVVRVHNVPFAADAVALADAMVRTGHADGRLADRDRRLERAERE